MQQCRGVFHRFSLKKQKGHNFEIFLQNSVHFFTCKTLKSLINQAFHTNCGGESGIRTHGEYYPTHDFQSCALDQLSHLSIKNIQFAFKLPFYFTLGNAECQQKSEPHYLYYVNTIFAKKMDLL